MENMNNNKLYIVVKGEDCMRDSGFACYLFEGVPDDDYKELIAEGYHYYSYKERWNKQAVNKLHNRILLEQLGEHWRGIYEDFDKIKVTELDMGKAFTIDGKVILLELSDAS